MAPYACNKCGVSWESDKRQPGFKETCAGCGAYLHSCVNCRFHLPSAHNQCYIPNTEFVGNRTGLNFCEEFEFKSGARDKDTQQKTVAREGFHSLFNEPALEEKKLDFEDLFSGL